MKAAIRFVSTWLAIATVIACASHKDGSVGVKPQPASSPAARCAEAEDRAAILAMAGSYDVVFDFVETEAVTPGYQKRPPHKTFATELVVVLADRPGHVSLQHVLSVGPGANDVVKHWRQDWTFESRELLEFQGRETWASRSIDPDAARCAWTQAVFGVEDAPRYMGYGRWSHDASGSVWQSNETWRPLPRREYTTRADYDVLVGVNRHRITNEGWDHEQQNAKLVLEPRHLLVRERGLNRYTRTAQHETKNALDYWQRAAPFWKDVRDEWSRLLAGRERVQIRTEVAGKRLHEPLFSRAFESSAGGEYSNRDFVRELLARYVDAAQTRSLESP